MATTVTLTNQSDIYHILPNNNYRVFALNGDDSITGGVGGNGNDTIFGGRGNDTISVGFTGSHGIFEVYGGNGNDQISGVGGDRSTFSGGNGNDMLTGSFGTFTLNGGAGDDVINLGSYSTGSLAGSDGNDTIIGNAQRDLYTMSGGSGNDVLQAIGNFSTNSELYYGNQGNDTISSLGGNDTLYGGIDNDKLTGGGGNDLLVGGSGQDVFIFTTRGANTNAASYTDTVADFRPGIDKIEFLGLSLNIHNITITHANGSAVIHYQDNTHVQNNIVLTGVDTHSLHLSDFMFV